MNPPAQKAIDEYFNRNRKLYIIPQSLVEFWNVYTRPVKNNGLGRTSQECAKEIHRLKSIFDFLPDNADVYQQWERLVKDYNVSGKQVHDTRIVAAMLVHQLTHILTFNTEDFKRFSEEITALHPDDV